MESPLLENDLSQPSLLEPSDLFARTGAPRAAVLCFFPEVVENAGDHVHAVMTGVYGGRPMYETLHDSQRVAFFYPGLGAPAAATAMEEAIAMGCRDFVVVGGAGALVPELPLGHAVVVDRALRDEGTSCHYVAPSRFVDADPTITAELARSLERAGLPFLRGATWTTDAIYRETRARMLRRVGDGCVTVEMEAAALLAVARFRGVRAGQLLYAGDSLSGESWDSRDWTSAHHVRETLFQVALSAAAALAESTS